MTTIRLATTQDIPDCLEASASRKDIFFTKEDFVRALDDSNAIYPVAEEDGKIAGFIIGCVNPTKNEEAMIQSTMVNARHGNKGIGTTHVRLVTVGKLVHLMLSYRQDAIIYYAEASSKFKSAESKFRRNFR